MTRKRNKHIGSSFNDFLDEQGTREETQATAIKRVVAWQLAEAMKQGQISKNQMAKTMNTSRSQLDRILDPENDKIQLDTLVSAARAVGRKITIELV